MNNWILFVLLLVNLTCTAMAAESPGVDDKIRDLENRLKHQEATLESMRSVRAPSPQKRKLLPDIGVVADIVAMETKSKADGEGNDKISVRELELVLGHDVDPYSRLDAVIAFSDFEDVSLEEAYLSRWDLPFDVGFKLGRFRPRLGKAVSKHRDSLLTVDEPLVVQEYFGVEGMSKTGFEVSKYLFNVDDRWTSDIKFGMLEGGIGEEGTMLGDTRRIPSWFVHWKNHFDFRNKAELELGLSALKGSSDSDSHLEVWNYGLDVSGKYNLDANRSLNFLGEIFLQNRDDAFLGSTGIGDGGVSHEGLGEIEKTRFAQKTGTNGIDYDDSPQGYYLQTSYDVLQKWNVGMRYDCVEPINAIAGELGKETTGVCGFISIQQSELARWRIQYQTIDYANDQKDDRIALQATFGIGVHKHAFQ